MTIELAGITFRILSQYPDIERLCHAYKTMDPSEIELRISLGDITLERERSARDDIRCGRQVKDWPDGYLETLAVYRKIAERMPAYNTFLFHGSCVAVDGIGYLFTAKSGTGKSTHSRLWRELLGDRAVMVNDDKPLIRVNPDGTATVYGTPWDGKHHLSTNIAVPLKAICILERAKQNTIRQITAGEAYPMLLQQAYRPMDSMALSKTLTLIDRLTASVSLWRLGCNRDIEAARVAYEAMKG
jgi:hypothetical protein